MSDDVYTDMLEDELVANPRYRLLDHNDTILASDEFLEDDCKTWTRISEQLWWPVGFRWHTALKPMRRIHDTP